MHSSSGSQPLDSGYNNHQMQSPTISSSVNARHTAVSPATKPGTSASPSRALSGSAARRRQSATSGQAVSTPVTQKSCNRASRTPVPKASTLASPGHLMNGSATKRLKSPSPGRIPRTSVSPKVSSGISGIPAGTLTSPGSVVAGSSNKSLSASPGRAVSAAVTQRSTVGAARTPSSTSASPGRVVSGSAAKRPQSASPGRAAAAQKSTVGAARTQSSTSASPSRIVSGSGVKSSSPGRFAGTVNSQACTDGALETPSTKASMSASRPRVTSGSAVKRPPSASPGHVAATPVTGPGTSRTPVAKSRTSASRRASAQESASPGHTVRTPSTRKSSSRTSRSPGSKPSPGHVPSDLTAKRRPGHVSPGGLMAATNENGAALTPTAKQSVSASPSHVVINSSAKHLISPSPGLTTSGSSKRTSGTSSTPLFRMDTTASPSIVASDSAVKHVHSASPGRVLSTPTVQTNTDDEARTSKSVKPAGPGDVDGSATKRRRSASAGRRAPSTPVTQKRTSGAARKPAVKTSMSGSPSCVDTGPSAEGPQSASPVRVGSARRTQTSSAGTSETPVTKPTASTSLRRSSSAAKRRQSSSVEHFSGTAVMQTVTGGDLESPATKRSTLTSPRRQRSSSGGKRRQSATLEHVSGTDGDLESPATKRSALTSPRRQRSSSGGKHRQLASVEHVSGTPVMQTVTDGDPEIPATKRSALTSPRRQRSSSVTKRHQSASPEHVSGTPVIQTVTGGDLESPATKRSALTSPRRQRSSSGAKRHQSAGLAQAPQTGADHATMSSDQQLKDLGTKRRESASPAHADVSPVIWKSNENLESITPKTPEQRAVSPLASSHKQSGRRGVKRSGAALQEPPHKQIGVSFGPDMSPELFDHRLPPMTPIKRGATPKQISTTVSAMKPVLKGRPSAVGSTVVEETDYSAVSVDAAKTGGSPKRRSKSATPGTVESALKRRSNSAKGTPGSQESNAKATTVSAQKPISKGRQPSVGMAEEIKDVEVSLDLTPKSAKRRTLSADRDNAMLDTSTKKKTTKTGNKRSRSLPAADSPQSDDKYFTKKVTPSKRARSVIGSRGSGDDPEIGNKSPVTVVADQPVTASPDRGKRTPQKPLRYRSPTSETGSSKVSSTRKILMPSPISARSLSPVETVAESYDQPITGSPMRVSRKTPPKPFRYRSPTLETGSVKVRGSIKISKPSPKRARSLSPVKVVAESRDQPVTGSPVRVGRTPPQPLRYRSPTLEAGSIRVSGSKKMATPSITVEVESSPRSSKLSRSPQSVPTSVTDTVRSALSEGKQKSAEKMQAQDVTTPVLAQKRKSHTGSQQKIKKSPKALSSSKKTTLPTSDLDEISSSLTSGKKRKTGGGGKNPVLDISTESTTIARAMTPGRMVAMRAVFGREMTPKLKVPKDESPRSSISQPMIASAGAGENEAKSRNSAQKSATKRSTAKVVSTKKSTTKKALWSEVVRRRVTTTQKSGGAKIIKPIIVKAQRLKSAGKSAVSVVSIRCVLCTIA